MLAGGCGKMEKRKRNKLIVIIIIAIFWFLLSLFLLSKILNENSKCMANPLKYSAELIEKAGEKENINAMALCSCDIGNIRIYFDKDGVYSENPLLKGGNLTPWAKE